MPCIHSLFEMVLNTNSDYFLKEKPLLQKLKITSCAFILCLFGLTLMTVSLAFAVDDDEFTICDNKSEVAEKLSCFREIVRNQRQGMENLSKASRSQEAIADEAVSKSADFVATLESQVDDLNIQLTAAESASKAAEAQIADLQSQLTAAQSGSQDAAKAAEKVELLLAFIDKQGSGDTSNIHIHKNYGHGGPEVRKNWNKSRGCQISYDEIQDLKASLKD